MSAHQAETIDEAARHWVIRTQAASFADWDALTEWLEQDPAHLAAYDAALDDDRWAVELFRSAPPPQPPEAEPVQPRRRWAFVGTAAAAAMVAVIGGWASLDRDATMREVATAAGERRTIELADGSRIVLNGGTRVTLDAEEPRTVALLAGEALFDVKHNERDPFVVTVGETRLVDAGTVFNVIRDDESLDVAVSHGAVIYAPGRNQIRLDAGAGLWRAGANSKPVVRRTGLESIGSWRTGQLQYDDAPLDRVVRDLSRNLGQPIRASRTAGGRRFTGTLVLAGSPERALARAGPLLGVRFTYEKDGWTMTPTDAAAH